MNHNGLFFNNRLNLVTCHNAAPPQVCPCLSTGDPSLSIVILSHACPVNRSETSLSRVSALNPLWNPYPSRISVRHPYQSFTWDHRSDGFIDFTWSPSSTTLFSIHTRPDPYAASHAPSLSHFISILFLQKLTPHLDYAKNWVYSRWCTRRSICSSSSW